MVYKAVYIKTYFDNMVLPYQVSENFQAVPGNWYVIHTKFGEDIGKAVSAVRELTSEQLSGKKPQAADQNHHHEGDDHEHHDRHLETAAQDDAGSVEMLKVIKEADQNEVKQVPNYREEEKTAYEQARKEIVELNLEMKLINVHIMYQRRKMIFNFTADNRIDFRQLVKKLAGLFKTRIEMRQIGVRDAAKILGGYGVCGVKNCCLRSNCHMNSIYLKMAKDQGFVVNSSKLTGSCGRLMCCLAYEMDFYSTERRKYPEIGAHVTDGQKSFTVISHNLIRQDVYLMDENHHQKKVPFSSLQFWKKDNAGTPVYKLTLEQPPKEKENS